MYVLYQVRFSNRFHIIELSKLNLTLLIYGCYLLCYMNNLLFSSRVHVGIGREKKEYVQIIFFFRISGDLRDLHINISNESSYILYESLEMIKDSIFSQI